MKDRRSQSGYSIAELLIVVAIIGLISLVAIPNFISMMRTAKVKSSVRMFTSHLRSARQIAITRNQVTKVTFATGPTARIYNVFVSPNVTPLTWTAVGPINRQLEESVYFAATTFEDSTDDADTDPDIIYRPNGTVNSPLPTETEDGQEVTKVTLKTDWDIAFNQYDLYFTAAGNIKSVQKKF